MRDDPTEAHRVAEVPPPHALDSPMRGAGVLSRRTATPRATQVSVARQALEDCLPFGLWLLAVGVVFLYAAGDGLLPRVAPFYAVLGGMVVLWLLEAGRGSARDISFYLLVPLLISAVQNIYLGLIAPTAITPQVHALVMGNIVYAAGGVFVLLLRGLSRTSRSAPWWALAACLATAAYAIVVGAAMGSDGVAALASLRNLLSPYVFFLLGILAAPRVSLDRFLGYVAALGWVIVSFGVAERYLIPDLWLALNIEQLWPLKGLKVHPEMGLPSNFFASEMVGGQYIRRMASSYADPISFGAVAFLVFTVAWFTRRTFLMYAAIGCCLLAVSKAAFVGFAVFSLVASYRCAGRMRFVVSVALTAAGVLGFLAYSLAHSTGSLFLHVEGFMAAVRQLPDYPFGRGVGNTGVVAVMLDEAPPELIESGLGMIVGQLGIPGLLVFACFLALIARASFLRVQDVRLRTFLEILFWQVVLNIVFNEVALSPNSSAGYFTILGLLSSGPRPEAVPVPRAPSFWFPLAPPEPDVVEAPETGAEAVGPGAAMLDAKSEERA